MRDYVQRQLNPQTWIERAKPWQLGLLILLLFGVSALAFRIDAGRLRRTPFAPQPSDQFVLIHDLLDVKMQSPPIVFGNTAVFPGSIETPNRAGLIAIDTLTGGLRWVYSNDEQSRPDWWLDDVAWRFPMDWEWGPIVTDGERIYTSDRFLLTTSINAFSLNGDPLWERELGVINGSQVRNLNVFDGQLVAHIVESGYAELTVLDVGNGRIQFRRDDENAANLYWIELGDPFLREYRTYNSGVDATQGGAASAWQFRFNNCGITPQMLETQIIIHARMCDENGLPNQEQLAAIFALDRQTGRQSWILDSTPVISNVAIDGERAYAIDVDSRLIALDLASGSIVGAVNFGQPDHELRPDERVFVGSGGGITAVYFSANEHLYIFEQISLFE